MTSRLDDSEHLTRTCLHCVLGRVLSKEEHNLAARGLRLSMAHSEAVWLPATGSQVYRHIKRLVRTAAASAKKGSPLRVAVHNLCGKSHVEVTASFRSPSGQQVLSCALPRQVLGTLWLGLEGDVSTH